MADYKANFKELKSRVGIDDVAYTLGYRLDRKAGVGRYIELVLGEGANRQDTIIVRNPRDKASQTFFRRNGSKGDVVTFIRENLNSFVVSGKDDWQKVAKVLARFANMPEPEYKEDREYVRAASAERSFDPDRYEVKPINTAKVHRLLALRGFDMETVGQFAPHISLIRDRRNTNFDGYNIGFPYTRGESDDIAGYEIRGMSGYKSKAAGSDSSNAAWVADMSSGKNRTIESVYFFESAFDAMAFHQMNRRRLGNHIALVSLGGSFSDNQIRNVLDRFPEARPFDCFDNDLAGRVNGLRLMSIVEDIPLKITKTYNGLNVEAREKTFRITEGSDSYTDIAGELNIRYHMGRWTPPKAYKDWNDCLLNKPVNPVISATKIDRDANLAEQRKSSIRI